MTITEALTYVKNMVNENAAVTPNWSDSELYKLFEAKSNMVLSKIGLVENKDVSLTTTAGTATYAFPSNFIFIRRVWVNGFALKSLGFREYESRRPQGTAPSGTPREMLIWAQTITVIPTPTVSAQTITVYGEKQQSSITSSASTLDCPSVFHPALCDMVLSDMFIKDLNSGIYDRINKRVEEYHLPAMEGFAKRRQRRGLPSRVIDADSVLETELGII